MFFNTQRIQGPTEKTLFGGSTKKGSNSRANRFTTYVWVTEHFSETKGQHWGQPRANRGPTEGHNLEDKKIRRYKKDHPLTPSFETPKNGDEMIDDFFQKNDRNDKTHVFTGNYPNGNPCVVFLSKQELDECIKIRGSHDGVLRAIHQIVSWTGRKFEITDWAKTIKTWSMKNPLSDRMAENEKFGDEIHDLYSESDGWTARIYHDSKKDQTGLLFEGRGAYWEPIFISFTDPNFIDKTNEVIKTKQMEPKY